MALGTAVNDAAAIDLGIASDLGTASSRPSASSAGVVVALTATLSGGRRIPAVGGVIRPDAALALKVVAA